MKYIFTLSVIFLTTFCQAQWVTNPLINTEVKDSLGPEESVPLQATTSDGSTYIAYFALYNGSYQMRLQLLDDSGVKQFGPLGLLVSNQPQSTAVFRYDLKTDANDNAILAFQDIRTGGNLHVVVYKIDKLGNFMWGNNGIQLIDPASDQGLSPTIGFTNSQNVIISWNASSSSNSWVAVSKLSPAGSLLWANPIQIIDPAGVKKYTRPTTVPAGTDDFSMLYVEQTGFGLGVSNMYANRFDSNGSAVWANPVHVSTKTISFFFFCKAVSDGMDGFFVGFSTSDNNFPSISDVYAQHVDGNGILWNPAGIIACNLTNTQRFCNATRFDPNSGFYTLIKTTDVNQNQSGVTIQSFDMTGNILLGPPGISLYPTQSSYGDPSDLTITLDGIIVFYTVGTAPFQTIQAMKCDFTGSLMWLGFPALICTNVSGKDDMSSGLFLNNQVVVVWMDNRNDYGIYAQNITNDGQLGPQTGLPETVSETNGFITSPNPFNNSFEVSAADVNVRADKIILKDLEGRILNTINFPVLPLSLNPEISSGFYFLEIYSANRTPEVIKIVRQ
jgi:hypothetical protein